MIGQETIGQVIGNRRHVFVKARQEKLVIGWLAEKPLIAYSTTEYMIGFVGDKGNMVIGHG